MKFKMYKLPVLMGFCVDLDTKSAHSFQSLSFFCGGIMRFISSNCLLVIFPSDTFSSSSSSSSSCAGACFCQSIMYVAKARSSFFTQVDFGLPPYQSGSGSSLILICWIKELTPQFQTQYQTTQNHNKVILSCTQEKNIFYILLIWCCEISKQLEHCL